MCRRAGFAGRIHVVNPVREVLADIATVPAICDLPEAPDAAFVALSRERSIAAMTELDRIGVAGAICHVAGFGELGGDARDLQDRLAASAGRLAMVGPNCMGLVNGFDRTALWGDDSHMEACEGRGVAVISQSGALVYGILNVERAFPMGYGVSVGNQAVIDTADLVDAVLDDERVHAIALYCEGLKDGAALGEALSKALARRIPVVLLRGGGTPAAAERSLSHTGNLAVPGDFWRALAERYGVVEVSSPKQLLETSKLMAIAGLPRGPRIFVAS
ncbi:MAG: CoA-binding protein [Hyphomicrobiaceae bacterium]